MPVRNESPVASANPAFAPVPVFSSTVTLDVEVRDATGVLVDVATDADLTLFLESVNSLAVSSYTLASAEISNTGVGLYRFLGVSLFVDGLYRYDWEANVGADVRRLTGSFVVDRSGV